MRPSPAPAIGSEPATIHSLSSRAVRARKSCTGPLPSASACARRSASCRGMSEKFSGNTATRAPRAAAAPSRRAALARFSAGTGPELICTAATTAGELLSASMASGYHDTELLDAVERFRLQAYPLPHPLVPRRDHLRPLPPPPLPPPPLPHTPKLP